MGSSLLSHLQSNGYRNLLVRSRSELDLLDQVKVRRFFQEQQPEYVFLTAAKVGGIHANSTYPADFIYENLLLACNVIEAAARSGVEKLVFLGSSCIYPKFAAQPIREESLLSGSLEPSNEPYAIAKIAGLKLCQAYQKQYRKRFISAMATNLFGPGDNYHPENSHVIPGMLRRFHEAKVAGAPTVAVWGSGTPRREFLYVDDLTRALVLLMNEYESDSPINVGTGEDLTIASLASVIKEVVGYPGKVVFDASKLDGTPRKVLDTTHVRKLGWKPKCSLKEGLERAYSWAVIHGKLDFDIPPLTPAIDRATPRDACV